MRAHTMATLVGVFETKTSGFKDASVTDISELSESIHTVIAGLSKKTGEKIITRWGEAGTGADESRRSRHRCVYIVCLCGIE